MAPVVTRRKNIQFALAKVFEGKPFKGPMIAQPKFDGLRMLLDPDNNVALTRTGLEVPNAAHILKQMRDGGEFKGFVLDCEGLADDWNLSQSIIKSQKPHPQAELLKAYCFDILPSNSWQQGICHENLNRRIARLAKLLLKAQCPSLQLTPSIPVHSLDMVPTIMQCFLDQGFEGAMLKDLESTYSFRKSSDWLKVKPFFDADLTIVSTIEGRGKHAGMLGALVLSGKTEWKGKNVAIKTDVGTGFTDQQRADLWERRCDLLGMVAEIKYQEVTKDGSVRFPVFHRIRTDK